MPAQIAARTVVSALVVGAVLACAAPTATAQATTTATIAPSLFPDHLGAKGALVFTIRYAGGESGVPSPVRRSVWRLPTGLSLEIPNLRSCATARLRARGPSACPPQSQVGTGHALAEVHAGSQIITEDIKLWAFVGPLQNIAPTFEILGQGYTPFNERMVFTGTVLPDRAPYGEDLVMSIPPIPTLPLEPDASIVTLSLTVGASARGHSHAVNTIVVPSSCPAGGFPFAAEFTYADGSRGGTFATSPCPR
jgi:hypothetical protein